MTEAGAPTRIVATCWHPRPAALIDRVRAAAATLEARGHAGDLVEARLDLLAAPPSQDALAAMVAAAPGRLLATCRDAPLAAASLRAGARALDAGDLPVDGGGALVIASHHAPAALDPASAVSIARSLAAASPELVKLAAPASSAPEDLAWAVAAADALPPSAGLAVIAWGPGGAWSRTLAARRGLLPGRPLSALAYARAGEPLPGGLAQPTLLSALEDRARADARLFAILGWPLLRTWSPRLHDALFRERGEAARLVALPVRDEAGARDALARFGLEGAAVTMPHKGVAAGLAATRGPRASRLRSANTLRRRGGAWEAEDFDGPAAAAALARALPLEGAGVVVLGAGGAARAAALAMTGAGARVRVMARSADAAREAALVSGASAWSGLDDGIVAASDALVNATPAGSPGEALPLGALPRRAVLDMATTPPRTELLRRARDRGLEAIDGLAMLALQAAQQQRWWRAEGDAPALDDARVEAVLRAIAAEDP